MNKEKMEVIDALQAVISKLEIHDHWKDETRMLVELLGAVKKSDGQL